MEEVLTALILSTARYDLLVSKHQITNKLFPSLHKQPRLSMIPGAEENCLPFYRLEDATALREKIDSLVNRKGHGSSRGVIKIAIIGGGYSGVEVAASIAERLSIYKSEITIYERNKRIMGLATDYNRRTAQHRLDRLGVKCILLTAVAEVTDKGMNL
jgi:NADH:ubiquinone reductase (non-electrogenic)